MGPKLASSPRYQAWGKRTLDVVITTIAAPLWLPIYVLVALILLATQGRPLHYRAVRPGLQTRPFVMVKFRTMRSDADDVLASVLAERPQLREEFERVAKLRDDPRVTPFGAFLRRTSLDELPQLWNVLRGDMSLVGPRPPATSEELEQFYGSLATHAFSVRPGLTGLWQVSRSDDICYERRVWLDLIYASRCSMRKDLGILVKTIPSVLAGRGAF